MDRSQITFKINDNQAQLISQYNNQARAIEEYIQNVEKMQHQPRILQPMKHPSNTKVGRKEHLTKLGTSS